MLFVHYISWIQLFLNIIAEILVLADMSIHTYSSHSDIID